MRAELVGGPLDGEIQEVADDYDALETQWLTDYSDGVVSGYYVYDGEVSTVADVLMRWTLELPTGS